MEGNTIQWGKRLLIFDLSKDETLMHFCFCKACLQEVADKLWPRLQVFLSGNRGSIKVNNDTYLLPYETLLLLVIYRLSRPRHVRKELEGFFGLHKSKVSTGITCMLHVMPCMCWLCSTLTILSYFTTGCHIMQREFIKNVGWLKMFGDSLI